MLHGKCRVFLSVFCFSGHAAAPIRMGGGVDAPQGGGDSRLGGEHPRERIVVGAAPRCVVRALRVPVGIELLFPH